jgi:hypothetical protein
VADLLSVVGVIILLLAGGLSLPHWAKRWRMDQALSRLQGSLGGGEIAANWYGWPRFSGTFQGRPCQISFETTLVSSSYGSLGDLAAHYRLGLSAQTERSISFERPSALAKWLGATPHADGKGLVVAGEFWKVDGPELAEAKRLVARPECGKILQALRVCKIVTLGDQWVEALEIEVSRHELRPERFLSMLTLLKALAEVVEDDAGGRQWIKQSTR